MMISRNRKWLVSSLAACFAVAGVAVSGVAVGAVGWGAAGNSPENAQCPVSQREVDEDLGTLPHRGMRIGFCSEQCRAEFRTWSTPQRERVLGAMRMDGGGDGRDGERDGREPEPERRAERRTGDPYTLDTCPISGGKLGSMGDPVELVLAGRMVKLCCAGCLGQVEAKPWEVIAKVDKAWDEASDD